VTSRPARRLLDRRITRDVRIPRAADDPPPTADPAARIKEEE